MYTVVVREMFVIPPFFCSSRFAYSEGSPIYLGRFLDLYAVWNQFSLKIFHCSGFYLL